MGKIILVTGGARSGKSSFAEQYIKKIGNNVLYIATAIAFDDEMKDRIKKHKKSRPEDWKTFEGYKNFDNSEIDLYGIECVLVDCLTIMTTNILLEDWKDDITPLMVDDLEAKVINELDKLLKRLLESECTAVLVTNEVGLGLVPEYPLGRVFRDVAGRVNQKVASISDEVYFCVSGIPMQIK